jgi:corrinoid protein of di/trimethylamine methyltransferase
MTTPQSYLDQLSRAIQECDDNAAENLARSALSAGIDALQIAEALTAAIRQVGDAFGRGDVFLPELIGAANAMQRAMPVVQEQLRQGGKRPEALGTVVLGTVYGDIHTIGKAMVGTLLVADGFEVVDLGVNVSAEQFIQTIREVKPDILAMSALMTMTVPEQEKVLRALERDGLRDRTKVMVGGGAMTQELAERMGADGYGATAPDAVTLARRFMGIEAE